MTWRKILRLYGGNKLQFLFCDVITLSENGNVYHITVARYLPGKSIAESNLSSKQLIDVAADVGRLAAYMHKCLAVSGG